MRSRSTFRACAPSSTRRGSRSGRCAASATCSRNTRRKKLVSSLRVRLLKALLPPVATLLVAGAVGAYFVSLEPASEAYDQALVDVGIALGERIRGSGTTVSFDLPGAAEQVLRTDKYDTIYYAVRRSDGSALAGDPGLPPVPSDQQPEDGVIAYDGEYLGRKIRVAALLVPC